MDLFRKALTGDGGRTFSAASSAAEVRNGGPLLLWIRQRDDFSRTSLASPSQAKEHLVRPEELECCPRLDGDPLHR